MIKELIFLSFLCMAWADTAVAVPETVRVRVADVTTSSFSIVWMTDVPATPNVEVYGDLAITSRLIDSVQVIAMPDAPPDVAAAARNKGIMKARVAGLSPSTTYYVRTATVDPADPSSISYSDLQQVTTAALVVPYREMPDGTLNATSNDLVATQVYIRPNDSDGVPGTGNLILLETPGSRYPLSAFVGVGTMAPEGVIDLNNLFGLDLTSLHIQGGEKAVLVIYRGGTLSTLLHYRKLPINDGTGGVGVPLKGFFADVNIDGRVDDQDFSALKQQYRTHPNDPTYNPDFNYDGSPEGAIDARDFAQFAKEYGRTGVQ